VIDLHPTTDRVIALLEGVDDHELGRATPMADTDLEGLLQHLLGLTVAFRDAAVKLDGPTTNSAPRPASGPLPDAWRELLVDRLGRLAEAWDDPGAWRGTTRAGGVQLPGDVCGLVALDEVLLHGWDVAAATGQPYTPTDGEAEAVLPVVTPADDPEQARREREGVFGEPVPVPADAPLFDKVLGLAGRDPRWQAPTA
jgi:uncharacterized protein (TIGR03086 family)